MNLGDFSLKGKKNLKPYEQAVTAHPEVYCYDLSDDIEFIIMACDGIWDCVDIQKFCEEISKRIKIQKQPLRKIIEELFDILISKIKNCKRSLHKNFIILINNF